MDFNWEDPEFIREFIEMDHDERREVMEDWLASIAEPFMGDSIDDKLARSMIGAMRSYMEGAFAMSKGEQPNRYIMGIWLHGYMQMVKNFRALEGIAGIKRSMEKKDEDD